MTVVSSLPLSGDQDSRLVVYPKKRRGYTAWTSRERVDAACSHRRGQTRLHNINEAVKLWTSIKEIWNRLENKCRDKIKKYLEEDQLGEKLTAIVNIYLKRLNTRLSSREE
ncbi:hypothetical protein MN116_004097 [Schistosoma mekongi]|uniref:Uncharacterized protein n=1 Tax=Schistosoma mekongi TaxID=38744 RepID=A0AAE1ZGC2_SCHME|nr:hypothetical protein MN116_004097 [Schistosoma mekongi]